MPAKVCPAEDLLNIVAAGGKCRLECPAYKVFDASQEPYASTPAVIQ
jgi:hypothetical protein